MTELFNHLTQIEDLLEQIDGITQNQGAVLLVSRKNLDEENNAIDLLEQMVEVKEVLMDELSAIEMRFQELYAKEKEHLKGKETIDALQSRVGAILKKKELIVERERNNLLIMKSQSKSKEAPLEVKPSLATVVSAYKKYQTKS